MRKASAARGQIQKKCVHMTFWLVIRIGAAQIMAVKEREGKLKRKCSTSWTDLVKEASLE